MIFRRPVRISNDIAEASFATLLKVLSACYLKYFYCMKLNLEKVEIPLIDFNSKNHNFEVISLKRYLRLKLSIVVQTRVITPNDSLIEFAHTFSLLFVSFFELCTKILTFLTSYIDNLCSFVADIGTIHSCIIRYLFGLKCQNKGNLGLESWKNSRTVRNHLNCKCNISIIGHLSSII